MKRLLAAAALLLVTSAAQAQYQFDYGGRTIRVDPDRGTVSIPGVYDNTGQKAKRTHRDQDTPRKPMPQDARSTPQDQPAQPMDPAPAATTAQPVQPPAAAPAATSAPSAAPPVQQQAITAPVAAPLPAAPPPVPPPPPTPAVAAVPPPAPPAPIPATAAAAPVATAAPVPPRDPNSPVGIWLTEEKEGKIRIEPCGANLCGYSVDTKSNQNREQILINMRPGQDKKWSGKIFDPNSGSTYDSTIAMKGADLRVQGCAFGGMFCGGQTWTRAN